jgi:hypothetical protein
VIINAILKVLETIGSSAKAIVGTHLYVNNQTETLTPLQNLIVNGIPPNELINLKKKSFSYPGMIQILNAGWQVLLSEMEPFAKTFGKDFKEDPASCKAMLNSLILKAVELDNVRQICAGSVC